MLRNCLESIDLLSSETPLQLAGASYDLAVSRGAAYYAKLKQTGEQKLKQEPLDLTIGIESAGMAIPELTPAISGLCVVEQGSEEGDKKYTKH